MANKSLLPDAIADYVQMLSPQTPAQKKLRELTEKLPENEMLSSPDQVNLLGLLVRLLGARRVLEVGTFTGYSALAIALALPADGSLVCCDVSEEWTSIGREHWREAGVDKKITLQIAPAARTLQAFIDGGKAGTFDLAFIDADKVSYDTYYELALQLLRPGGAIIFDNMLRSGEVIDPAVTNPSTVAIRALNLKIAADQRVDAALLTVGDGFMIARKK